MSTDQDFHQHLASMAMYKLKLLKQFMYKVYIN